MAAKRWRASWPWALLLAWGWASLAAVPALALDPARRIEQYSIASWDVAALQGSKTIFAILQSRDGYLWLGGSGGLLRFDGIRFELFEPANTQAMEAAEVRALLETASGDLWVGILGGGVLRLREGHFEHFGSNRGLPSDLVRALAPAEDGSVWVGTQSGLARIAGDVVVEVIDQRQGLPQTSLRALYKARSGDLYIGIERGGFCRKRADRLECFGAAQGLDGKWQTFGRREGLGADSVRVLLVDRDDDLWAGTMGGGLSRIHEGQIETFEQRDGLGSDSVLSLYQDDDGNLWIGTLTGGLSLLKDGRFTSFDRRRGFVADAVGSIVPEGRDALWISAKGGPFRFERADLLRLFGEGAAGRADHLAVMAFGSPAGFLGAPATGFTPAALRLRDGCLVFASSKGMNVVDPAKRLAFAAPPPPLIESLLANHQKVDLGAPILLPAGTYDLEIHYAAPSFEAPQRTRFRYRLVGFDHDWVEVGERRVAYYPNLPPGEYRFEVAAADEFDPSWLSGAALPVILLPYLYQTWWFKALLLVLLAWALWGFYKVRTDRLEARAAVAEERNRLAREIHDTIAQDLTAILMQARMAQRLSSEGKTAGLFLGEIATLAAGSLTEARRSLQTLRPPALEGKTLAQALREVSAGLAQGHGVEIAFSAAGAGEPAAAVEVELLRIAKEAMGNALRHGGAQHLEVELCCEQNEALLRVRDDGSGFDPQAALGGFGLIAMRERAESLGGSLRVESRPGAGSLVEVRTPLKGREK